MKLCKKCNQEKDEAYFYINQSWCKDCKNNYDKQCRLLFPERYKKQKEQSKKWHLEHKEDVREHQKKNIRTIKSRFRNAKKQALKRNKNWSISIEEYKSIIDLRCYYCNGFFGKVETGCGLDRIDSSKGYEINNVVSCCYICNIIKSNILSVEEMKAVVNLIITMRAK
jgi:hypothetical protein